MPRVSAILFGVVIAVLLVPKTAFANVNNCDVSVSPNALDPGTSTTLTFSFQNTDENGNLVKWIKITAPTNFVITSADGPYIGSVNINSTGSEVAMPLSGLSSGEHGDYVIGVSTSNTPTTGVSFGVEASDTTEGDNPATCVGDTNVAINAPSESSTINISNPTVSITDTTARISWNTNLPATSLVTFGTSDQYGSQQANSSLETNHTVLLSGLSVNTLYHYQISSTDADGKVVRLVDNSFTTASPGVTTSVSTPVSSTTTQVPAVQVAPVLIIDTTAPNVKLTSDFSKPFKLSPPVAGSASDPSGISKTDYSTDGGANWLPIISPGLGGKSVSFNFNPDLGDDGDYKIVVRAIDGAGNVGYSQAQTLVIDRLPPLVGGSVWSIGPIPLAPDSAGELVTLTGVDNRVVLSAIGGPISIDLYVNQQKYPLEKSSSSGLWIGTVNFSTPGYYRLLAKSIDGAKNITERKLNSILVLTSGHVLDAKTRGSISAAKLQVFEQDSVSKSWNLWQGQSFGQKQPQVTNPSGSYSYFLPPGTYYLRISAPGYQTTTTDIFKLDTPSTLNTDFELARALEVHLGNFVLSLPDLSFKTVPIFLNTHKRDEAAQKTNNGLVGTQAPQILLPTISGTTFNLAGLRGQSQLLVFTNTWLPQANEQISQTKGLPDAYQKRVTYFFPQETSPFLTTFSLKGGYQNLNFVADPDGTLIIPYDPTSLPTNYLITKKGVIEKIIPGVLSESATVNYLDSY